MSNFMPRPGRSIQLLPGPTPVPERVSAAMCCDVLDHRGPAFQELGLSVLKEMQTVFRTKNPVIIYAASGTGAWEAAIVNTLSPGDRVLTVEGGHFASMWTGMAKDFGLLPDVIPTDWRTGPDPDKIAEHLSKDKEHAIKAVFVVHNETSTGVRGAIEKVREAMDATGHPALLMVDAVSSLAGMDYRHDEWGVDVSVSGSQKGLMLPPGLAFTAISERALAATATAKMPRYYWSWAKMLAQNKEGYFPFTPATGLLHGLAESIAMLREEGFENVFARHERNAEAVRRAVRGWGLEVWCLDPESYSPAVTAVGMPEGHDAVAFRKLVHDRFDVALAMGLGKLAGKVFRIGHLGFVNDVTLLGGLTAIERALAIAKVPHSSGGVAAAMDYLG